MLTLGYPVLSYSVTIAMRSKEDDLDYCFMPEPNLPPLLVEDAMVRGDSPEKKNI